MDTTYGITYNRDIQLSLPITRSAGGDVVVVVVVVVVALS